jgi:group II intron reverse transcriptase/maturase
MICMKEKTMQEAGGTSMLLEEILGRENLQNAYKQVMRNKGSAGVDGEIVENLQSYLWAHWATIKTGILLGTYKPKPVKRVEIPKPNGGKRPLGIPTVIDRLIQQAISQQLMKLYDKGFSEFSYGFRPGRSANMAVLQAQQYLNEGYKCVVEIDLEKFFDTVNQDRLMNLLSKSIEDKRVLRLIRRYLQSGVQIDNTIEPSLAGTPQGSPMSPVLSNIVLDELDKELESRGHKFVRYADDFCIFTKSERAGARVLESVSSFIKKKLKLKVNRSKSRLSNPYEVKLLGYGFYCKKGLYRLRIHRTSIMKIKLKVKGITRKTWPIKLEDRITSLKSVIRGWVEYFKYADCQTPLYDLDCWLRRRLRYCVWETWKLTRTRIRELHKLGATEENANAWGRSRLGGWRLCRSFILHTTLNIEYFHTRGYVGFTEAYSKCRLD